MVAKSQYTNLFVPSFETDQDEEIERKTEMQTLNGGGGDGWRFKGNKAAKEAASVSMKGTLSRLFDNCSREGMKTILPLGHCDPIVYPCFTTSVEAEEAVAESLRSGAANSYAPGVGILPARRAVANYLNSDLPHKLKSDDIFMTIGCCQGIETMIQVLSSPKSNILLSTLVYPLYHSYAIHDLLEIRKYELLPDQDWEIDLQSVEAIADDNTVAMVICNPHNPCGNVYTYHHLKKVAEMARRLGIMVISDEVFKETIYGKNPFVPMGIFASIVPVVTLGSISKGWLVPGWRIGWMAMNDPNNVFKTTGVVESIKHLLNISPDPSTILQFALPNILEKTKKDYFEKKNLTLSQNVDMAFDALKEIPCLVCPKKPESCTSLVAKLDLSLLEDITDDVDFCMKLAREQNLVLLPGEVFGKNNWVRISIGVERSMIEDAFVRLKCFFTRHVKSQTT